MPPSVLSDRYWLVKYQLLPGGGKSVADLPLDDYFWFPLIDQAENEAARRRQAQEARRSRPQRRGGL